MIVGEFTNLAFSEKKQYDFSFHFRVLAGLLFYWLRKLGLFKVMKSDFLRSRWKNPTVATCANTAGSSTSMKANGIQAQAQKFRRAALTLSSHVQISALTKTLSYRLGSIFARKRLFGLMRRLLDAQLMIFLQNRSARMWKSERTWLTLRWLWYWWRRASNLAWWG